MRRRDESETWENRREQLEGLPIIRRNVAGIDLGSERHWVCAPTPNAQGREITSFGATTPELIRMAEWLKARRVESVAMESTGVYWIAPHEVLEAQGLQVLLVDTRQLARVPGRDKKTDPTDCEWIQQVVRAIICSYADSHGHHVREVLQGALHSHIPQHQAERVSCGNVPAQLQLSVRRIQGV